jgi:hypothetical protein
MTKLFIQLLIVGFVGFVLFDTPHAVGLQIAYLVGWMLTRIPGTAWIAFFEAIPSLLFWFWVAND